MNMESRELGLPGVKLITLTRHKDFRGWLNETWRDSWNEELGLNINFVQDMWSVSKNKYTLRGMHALKEEAAQYKLIIVLQGDIFDVIVDARKDSPTYKKHISVTLSGDMPYLILVPPGCYHGYLTLTDNVILGYKVDQYHSADLDSGIHWADPEVNIPWPLNGAEPIISDKDKNQPLISQL